MENGFCLKCASFQRVLCIFPSLSMFATFLSHSKYYRFLLSFILLTLLLILPFNARASWNTTTLDSTGYVGKYTSIAIDSGGKAHISYYDISNDVLKYAKNASGSWVTTTLDSTGDVGKYSSIAIDSSDNVHISYFDKSNYDLKYATNASGSWVKATLDPTGNVGMFTSIAIDSGDNAHISYYDYSNANLMYATNASGSWVTATLDSTGAVGQHTSMAIDSGDNAHISYYDVTNANLKYATNASGSWVATTLDSTGNVGLSTSIAIDSGGKAHISYYDMSNGALKYATNASGLWVTTTLDSTGDFTSIAVDSENNIHISYFGGNSDLKYAIKSANTWRTYTVDSTGIVGTETSIAVDSASNVHISYQDYSNYDLKHTTYRYLPDMDDDGDGYTENQGDCNDFEDTAYPGAPEVCDYFDNDCDGSVDEGQPDIDCLWTIEELDSSGSVGENTSIAVDAQHKVHISYYDSTTQDLKYKTNISGAWTAYTLDASGDAGTTNSIKLDSQGYVHVSYYDATNGDLKYTTNASGSWVIQVIDSTGDVGKYSSIAIGYLDKVHISYSDATNEKLKYATNASGAWFTQTITDQWPDSSTSIAVDSNNNVHIAYVDAYQWDNSRGIKHITNTSGSWISSEIDYRWAWIGLPSIAVDSNNIVHIIYSRDALHWGEHHIMYATNGSGSWSTDLITYDAVGHRPNSFAIDSDGNIHTAFHEIWTNYVYYVTNQTGSWLTTKITLLQEHGSFSSLTVDPNDNVHISGVSSTTPAYHEYTTNALGLDIDDDGDGYSEYQGDCRDSDISISPGATEIWYDGTDQNCDGWNDYDRDMDTYVDTAWNAHAGGTSPGTDDCNDSDPAVKPGAAEIWYDGADRNCDGWNDYDQDMDTYVDTAWNSQAGGTSPGINDCNDTDAVLNPETNWYTDFDGDGYGDPAVALVQCTQPAGHVLNNTDCNDYDVNIYPGGPPARITGTTNVYFSNLLDAYEAAVEGETIQCQDVTFNGDMIIDLTVSIEGGYDCSYSAVTGKTAVNGTITIINGSVMIENLLVE